MPDRPPRTPRTTVVEAVERLSPGMVRVVVGGPELAGFEAGAFTDHYVKLQFPSAEDPDARPTVRTYSVRDWDAAAGRLTIDFVVHGATGVAGPWAATAAPGDTLRLVGPGGAYAPDPDAAWHLLAGDASVLPAIAASLARVPADVPVFVVAEVDGPQEELPLPTPGRLTLVWVHRSAPPGEEPDLLTETVRTLELPAGAGQAFVHGEASSVRALRRHLLVERGLPKERVSASGYWKLRRTEEGWREDKAEWARLAETDVA